MSEVVGSTPSFTRSGRSSASFACSSSSLMICAAPCLKTARASSGRIANHRIAHRAGALLVFVQQLAHLLDRERRILPVERLLTFTLLNEGSVLRVRAARNFFVRLRGIARATCSLSCIGRSRIPYRLLRRTLECAAFAMERPRIELARQEVVYPEKPLRIGLFLDVKCANGCFFIYGGAIGDKSFVLRVIPQRRVRPEQPIDQFAFLVLSVHAGRND